MSETPRPFVLIVEDNTQLSRVMSIVLKAWPSAIADTVDSAWAAIEAGPPPACILCDTELVNKEPGVLLYQRIRAQRPELLAGFVWFTGGPDPATMNVIRESGLPMVVKPVSNADLRALVTQICAQ